MKCVSEERVRKCQRRINTEEDGRVSQRALLLKMLGSSSEEGGKGCTAVTWRKGEKALASKTSILSHSAGEVRLLCQGKADRVSQMPGVIPQH